MKKILTLGLLAAFSVTVSAQSIRLPEKPKNRTEYTDFSMQTSGYWTAVELNAGSTVMFNRSNMQPVSVDWVNGYRINEFVRAGIGVGVKYLVNNDKMRRSDIAWTFPIYADVRGNFISQQDREAVPFWAVDLGGEIRGGLFFSPTLGYRFGTMRSSLLLGINYTLSTYDTWKKDNDAVNSLSIKIGYEF